MTDKFPELTKAKNLNDQIKLEKFGMTQNQLQNLGALVDRIVDNMSEKTCSIC